MISLTLVDAVICEVRQELSEISEMDGKNKDYEGLCDKACDLIEEKIKHLPNFPRREFDIIKIHGEMRHSPKIDPGSWPIQHTWVAIREGNDDEVVYADATSQQFQGIWRDIPDYYVSASPPK